MARSSLVALASLALGASPVDADEMPAPPADLAAFPAATPPAERPPGYELHGVLVPWWTLGASDSEEAWRLRWAVLRVDARPAPGLSMLLRVGLMLPGSPLLDAAATYFPARTIGITFGQFRLPLGAAATTLGPQLVMLDRPAYVYAMTKQTFRDVGVMVHGPPEGQAGFHYRLAFASGGGRIGAAQQRSASEYLVAGRAMFDHRAQDLRIVLGATGVVSRDPAAVDDAAAAGMLGRTLAPIEADRTTLLAGADATLALGPVWLQAEVMYLRARATDDSVTRRALGASLEAAWTLPRRLGDHTVQLAMRDEWFDRSSRHTPAAGVNVTRTRLRWSVFASADDVTFRAVATF